VKFLNPKGLWLLLGIPVLIIIYLIKAQHEDRAVSSTYIWQLSSKFMKKRLPVQKLKRILAFILQLAVIVSIALLAARPAIESGDACDYILIIDASASMLKSDTDGKTRFDKAVEQASAFSSEIEKGHTVSIILAAGDASYILQNSTSQNEVKLTLKNVSCSYEECDVDKALSLAKLLCDHSENPDVIFFTDRDYECENVGIVNLANEEWNVSVSSLTYQKNGKDYSFEGSLTSYGKDATLTVGLRVDGSIVDAKIIDLEDSVAGTVEFTRTLSGGFDTAEIFIETSDSLSADNSYAVCRKNERSYSVTLVSASPLYLESCLKALGNVSVSVAATVEEAELSGKDIYIFDGIYPESYPEDGSVIQLGTEKLPDGISAGDTVPEVADLEKDPTVVSELYELLHLSGTVVSEHTPLAGNSYWEKLLYCGNDPVLCAKKNKNGTAFTVISFDLHNSNLPMQADFVTLFRNLIEYSAPSLIDDTDYTAGEAVKLSVTGDADLLYVVYPDESIKTLSTASNTASIIVEVPGIYTAVLSNGDAGEYAGFYVHLPASEITDTPGGELKLELAAEENNVTEHALEELWFWIVAALLLIILIEWGLYCYEHY